VVREAVRRCLVAGTRLTPHLLVLSERVMRCLLLSHALRAPLTRVTCSSDTRHVLRARVTRWWAGGTRRYRATFCSTGSTSCAPTAGYPASRYTPHKRKRASERARARARARESERESERERVGGDSGIASPSQPRSVCQHLGQHLGQHASCQRSEYDMMCGDMRGETGGIAYLDQLFSPSDMTRYISTHACPH
jgi:hypothetical protein